MLSKEVLQELYLNKKYSAAKIAHHVSCSENKVNYWIAKHGIQKRTIGDALYLKHNPKGDPFTVRIPKSINDAILYGLGVGLYWGEGTKANKTSVRIGNTDPRLICAFIRFLEVCYGIDRNKLKFGLQIFGDMNKESTLRFWTKMLGVPRSQFQPGVVVTPYRGVGNYRNKTKHGVITLYFNNRKLRDIICQAIDAQSVE
jgi:hypothetical protein